MNEQTENSEYTIVRLSEDNINALTALDNAVYGKPLEDGYYRKKYNSAYTGKQYFGHIAYVNNTPVAYYGVIPVLLQVGGKTVVAAQSADSMTIPSFHGKGLYTLLSKYTFALCIKEGIELVFGFPNQNSYKPAIRLGWKEPHWMDAFTIDVKALPLAGIANRLPVFQKLYSAYKKRLLAKYAAPGLGISNALLDEGWYGIARPTEYLQYKTYNQTHVLRIGNSLVWLSLRNGLLIGDIALHDDFTIFIGRLKRFAKKLGIRKIQFVVSRDTKLHGLFATLYKPAPAFPSLFQMLNSTLEIEKVKFTYADVDVF